MTHYQRRDWYSVNDDKPMLGSVEDYSQEAVSGEDPEYDLNYDEEVNKLLDEAHEDICKEEKSIKDKAELGQAEDFHVGSEFWYQGKCKSKIKETKERLEDLSKLASYSSDFMKAHIKRIEQDHGTTFCKMDLSPRHPPLNKPWTNSWKFNCTLKRREAKSNHFQSSGCEEIVLEHVDPNVSSNDYPIYIKEAVKLFEDFAHKATKNMSLADGKGAADVLGEKSMWTGVKVILRSNYCNDLMMIVRGKKMGFLVPKLRRYFDTKPERNTKVISVYCINPQWSRPKPNFDADCITGISKLKDIIGPLSIEYKAKTNVDFNAIEAAQLAKIVVEYAGLTNETIFLDIGCSFGVLSLMMSLECQSVIGVNTMHSINNEMVQAEEIKKHNKIDNASFIPCNPEDLITKCSPFIKNCITVAALNLSTPYGKNKHVIEAFRNMPSIWRVIVHGSFTKEFHKNINALVTEDQSMGEPFLPMQGCILDKSPSSESFDMVILFERESLITPKIEILESGPTLNMKVEKYEYGFVEKKEDKPCSSIDGCDESKNFEEKSREKAPAPPVAARKSDYVSRRNRPFLDSPPSREKDRSDHSSTRRPLETERLKEKFDSRFRPVSREDESSSSRKDRSSNRKDRSSSRRDRSRDRSSSTSTRRDRSRDRSSSSSTRRDRSRDRSSSSSTRETVVDHSASKNGYKEKSLDFLRLKNGNSRWTFKRERSPSANSDRSSSMSTREKFYDLSAVKKETIDPNGFDISPLSVSPEKRPTGREQSSQSHKKSSHSSKNNIFTEPKITVRKEFKFKYHSPPRDSPMSPLPVPPLAEYSTLTRPLKVEQIQPSDCDKVSEEQHSPPQPVPASVKYPVLTKYIKEEPIQSCNGEENISDQVVSPPQPVPPPSETLLELPVLSATVKAEPMEPSESTDVQIFKVPLKVEPAESSEANCNNIHQPIILKVDHSDSPMSPVKPEPTVAETPSNLQGIEYMETPIHRPRAFTDDSPLSPQIIVPTSFGISVQSNLSFLLTPKNDSVNMVQIKKEKDAADPSLASVTKKPDEIPVVKIKSEVIDPDYGESFPEVGYENVPLPVKVKSEPVDSQDTQTQAVRVKNEPEDMDISPQGTPEVDNMKTPIYMSTALSDTPRSPLPSSSSSSSIVDDSEFSVNTKSSYLPKQCNSEQPKASVNVKKELGETSSTSSSSSEEEIQIIGEKKKPRSSPPKIRIKTVEEIIKVKTEIKEAEELNTLFEKRQAILKELEERKEELPRAYKRQISSPSPPPRKYKRSPSPSLSPPPRKYKRSSSPSPRKYSRSPSPHYGTKRKRRSPSIKRLRRPPSPSGRRRRRSPFSPNRFKKEPMSPPSYRRKERSKRSSPFNKREIYGKMKDNSSGWDRHGKRSRSKSPRRS